MKIEARTRYYGTNIKQSFCITTYTQELEYPTGGKYWDWNTALKEQVLVGMSNGELRLRYPNASRSGVKRLSEATTELKSLAALLICNLVPAGVFADALEESFPQHQQAAQILRKYQQTKETQQ